MDLRAKFEATVLSEIGRVGIDAFDRAAVVRRFSGEGTSPRTLYRWVQALFDGGRAGQHLARTVQEAAAARAAASPDPAADAARAVGELLPAQVTVDDIAGGGSTVRIIETLASVVADVRLLVRHAKTDDGRVRNSKLLLSASAELRKCLETAVRLQEALRDVQQIDKLHAAIIDEIAKEAPELAERMFLRVDRFCSQFEVTPEGMR